MPTGTVSSSVAVVAIDEEAIQRVGPWPWPRDGIARTVDRLRVLGARAVGLAIPLQVAETASGQAFVLPVLGVGPDGTSGTADDTVSFGPGQQGQAEFLLEGRRETRIQQTLGDRDEGPFDR